MKRKLNSSSDDAKDGKKLKENENGEADDDQIFNFDIKSFRKKLKGHNFVDDLQFFVKNSKKSPQLVSDFLEMGGRPLEVVEAIGKHEANADVLSNLYQMLLLVCSSFASDDQIKCDAIVQGLKFLVTKHGSSVMKILSSAKATDKKTALKVLAIGASTNRDIGMEILKNVELFTKSKSKEELAETLKTTTKHQEQVRETYLEFIISFFKTDTADATLRKRILQNRNLFELLLQDLHKDSSESIERVLSVLAEKVLMSPDFNKVEKFKAFSDDAVKYLIKLYDWKGVDAEREHVRSLSHYFLKILLTNKKYGIVFKTFTEKCKNLRQVEVIKAFKNVWMQEYPSKLVIEIVKACPDLIQIVHDRLVYGLQPRKTVDWFMCMNFTRNLLTALDPKVMINFFTFLQAKKVSANIIKLSISQYILQNVSDNALIQQDSLEIREASAALLHLMLDHCCKFLDEMRKLTNLKDFEQHRIKFDVINHIFTFFPHIDIILNSLYRSINLSVRVKSDDSEKLVKSQLRHTLEILLLLIERFPSIVEKIPSVIDYLEVLRPIYEYQVNVADMENNSDLEIEMKVVKIILLLKPNILSLDAAMFNKIFSIIVQVFSCSKNDDYRKEAKTLVSKMLQSSSIFPENSSLEISIWLEALRVVKASDLKETASKFIELIKSIKENKQLNHTQEAGTLTQELLAAIDSADDNLSSADDHASAESAHLSPLLPCLLRMKPVKLNKITDFAEISFVLFYHTYADHKKSLKSLLAAQHQSEVCKRLLVYVNCDEISDFGDILPSYSDLVYRRLQQSIIADEEFDVKTIGEGEHQFVLLQSVFCAIKLSESDSLTDEKIQLLIGNIRECYKRLQSQDEEETLSLPEDSTETDEKEDAIAKVSTRRESALKVIARRVFDHESRLFKKFNVRDESSQITRFVIELVNIFTSNNSDLDCALIKYREKVISHLAKNEIGDMMNAVMMKIVEEFPFGNSDYAKIMEIVLKNPTSLEQLRYVMVLLKRMAKTSNTALSAQQLQSVEDTYVAAVKNPAFDFNTEFCDIFHHYLAMYPHSIADTTSKLFELALLDELTVNRSFIKLLSTLFTHNDVNNQFFIENGLKLKKEILYPILHIAFKKNLADAKMVTALYQMFKSGIVRTIEKPSRAAQIYRENVKSTIQLIERGMPINECRDLSMKKFKFDSTEVYQMEMLSTISLKAFEKEGGDKSTAIFINFISNWLQMFALAEKRMYGDFEKALARWFNVAPKDVNCDKLDEKNWELFYTTCLKLGLKSMENSYMLVLLAKAVRILDIDTNLMATIFDMVVTHSNFCALVFNSKSSSGGWKRDLFYLLNVLVQRNPLIAHKKHIPIYFSSYQATMSSCDQLILNLLRFYELNCNIDFYEFRPFLFGTTALTHFSSLDQNELKITAKTVDEVKNSYFKVLNSFEKSMIASTMANFPTKRTLAIVDLYDLDQLLLTTAVDEEEKSSQIYDPVFFLPLFELFLNTSNFNFISLATKKNLIGLLPLGLSCEDESMRLMTSHVLLKCRESAEGTKNKKELWIEFYECIQKGLSELRKQVPKGHKNGEKVEFPRVAPISSLLLAEFFNILPDKLHCVHNIVSNYVIVKDKFEFTTLPELNVLFCSSDLNHEEHRLFLLNTISSGIKNELDFKLLNNTPIIKMMLACYGCPISTRKIDLAILKIFDSLVVKAKAGDFLVERYGLLLWIYQVCVAVEAFEYDTIDMIIAMVDHLQAHFAGDAVRSRIIMSAFLLLLEKFTKTKLAPVTFEKFISTLNAIQNFIPLIACKHYELVLEMAEIFFSPDMRQKMNYFNRHPVALATIDSSETLDEGATEGGVDEKMFNQCKQFIKNFHSKKQ